ncbi:hypothetical protein ACQYAD_10930 [Neobacillus sp. SM06]|uniref:hypothetical protein n=1 Tax=Neobacillus sp. SM06 TaxID=3422492 RepID=UPI003D2A24DA
MGKKDNYLTNAPKQTEITIQTGGAYPNQKHLPGDSVEEHKYLEEANALIAGDEIRQQNKNL